MYQSNLIKINGRVIGNNNPTYFIADIASNHDGDLERAINLIKLAANAGANAAKFQHFNATTIVSDKGFKLLGDQQSHQKNWQKSVFDIYKDCSLNPEWTIHLKNACDKAGITFLTSPYAFDLVDEVDSYVPAYKIGSGDITWIELLEYIAQKNKPIILGTGASTTDDVERAVQAILRFNPQLALLQCNTNYSGDLSNFSFVNLNVLKVYREMYPELVLGLSDHTPGNAAVLGAVALGARIIEKHFTDDPSRSGPDHTFSMDPQSWREMVDRTRELEASLGSGVKKIENNEIETVVLQRRSIRLLSDLPQGTVITRNHLTFLRPCPDGGLPPYEKFQIIGRVLRRDMYSGDLIQWTDLE